MFSAAPTSTSSSGFASDEVLGARVETTAPRKRIGILLAIIGTLVISRRPREGPTIPAPRPAVRRLEQTLPSNPTCRGSQSLPVNGVRYVPRLVGEPHSHPEADPRGYYAEAYKELHKRDLPLIGEYLGADTLALDPWPTYNMEEQHRNFFMQMRSAGVCKMVPTFHVAKYFADMLREGYDKPKTDPSSAFAVDFTRFAASVNTETLRGAKMVAWTVDLSLDLNDLLPLTGGSCQYSTVTRDESFRKYMMLMDAIQNWVHPSGSTKSVAPALQDVPFLIPLDLSRAPYTEPGFEEKMKTFMQCMSRGFASGGWSSLFTMRGQSADNRPRWLLSFASPGNKTVYHFRNHLYNISTWLKEETLEQEQGINAIVMAATQALRAGDANPINTLNLVQDNAVDNNRYVSLYRDYNDVRSATGNLDGFFYDEWADDWDRCSRGPFFIAGDTLHKMAGTASFGGRFHHDINECSRTVGSDAPVYPEYFGLAASSSQLFRHCLHPRFDGTIFGAVDTKSGNVGTICKFMSPSGTWMLVAAGCFVLVSCAQVLRMLKSWCKESKPSAKEKKNKDAQASLSETPSVGFVTVCPKIEQFQGGHQIELQSRRFKSNEEAGWWLWTHAAAQMAILERQVTVESRIHKALRNRKAHQVSEDVDLDEGVNVGEEDLASAMRVTHQRVLEGFAAWCSYVAGNSKTCGRGLDPHELRHYARKIKENTDRPLSSLFVEALLIRVLECLGEQMLQCPERISYLLCKIFRGANGMEDDGPSVFAIDFEELHDGLTQMNAHTNPYVYHKNHKGKWELGLNFDDINESGIQCREEVGKTFREPSSVMVLIDFLLCYRVPFMIKFYCLEVAGYIFLGSHQGDDITTTHNGDFFDPKWLRMNYLQYTAIADAGIWFMLEALLVTYVLWQRWPSMGYKSPGVPGLQWVLEHLLNMFASLLGGFWVFWHASLTIKPWQCAQSNVGICVDERTEDSLGVLRYALTYWACRAVVLVVMNSKTVPIFIHGTPSAASRKGSGRGCWESWSLDLRVNVAWLCMLALCIVLEVMLLLPTMRGLDWGTTCGLDLLGPVTGKPSQDGACTERDQLLTFACTTCLASVSAGWLLVFLGSLVDIYFVFYFASALVGSIMGHKRHLNDLKNTSLPIDLRPGEGKEARLFERTFGSEWQQVWRIMVKSLAAESLISPKQAQGLVQAAGVSLDGAAPLTSRERKMKPIHLTRFPHLAGQRLAFFFQSLKWIESHGSGPGLKFEANTDALTSEKFDPGSIPSVTQIIPAYNEVVIPSVEFLRAGAEPEDAKNSSPDDQPGLGDLTVPPAGDGVNTNLGFMISQFPDEWVFLVKRLHQESWIECSESQEFYHDFLKHKVNPECVAEIRLWAAMRMQSVAKTVIGALQYGRSLASLPAVKQYYAEFPDKRLPEDHCEVILAHQTYGHSEGVTKNDEAVRMLMERHSDDPLFLVFDLKKGSSQELWSMVDAFLRSSGGVGVQSLEQASVKCKWDKVRRCLQVIEVLPRMFPLRLGQGDYKTQGKACNQLNGLRFATGHFVQALDCNMGAFIGEGFKIPYVLRMFMPPDQEDRSAPRCRYLGFREYIYTSREGTVGKCHAAAEWTFGTIYQRFLSGMGCRMHYGHPDFLDGFWARNRGGMSKSSPVVNLSEDIFAGFNVRMREEKSPHIDSLEFEKGREATFNAASNFFSKISGGSVSVVRSRDNHLLCERIGLLHSLSFYFTSVAFYASNLFVDFSIYLYVILFILFNLTGLGPGELSALGSTFSTEWIISMGLVSLFPQLAEVVLEVGAVPAVKEVLGGMVSATFFFIFQNKNIASAMKEGAMTGIARYFFTGRPPANQHQTWKDIYASYWKSHYKPAFFLGTLYLVYSVLGWQNREAGKLPMVLVVISFTCWVITPIVFSPFPRWNLIVQDIKEFNGFITGHAGTADHEIAEVISRGKRGTVRSLYECGLAEELCVWSEHSSSMLVMSFLLRVIVGAFLVSVCPAGILDYLSVYVVVLGFSWVVVFGYFIAGLNNIFLIFSFLLWIAAVPFGHFIIGARAEAPSVLERAPEYLISLAIFSYALQLAKNAVLLLCRFTINCWPRIDQQTRERRLHECIRVCFVYFCVHQTHFVEAYIIMLANTLTAIVLATIDRLFCNVHTWFLLNSEMARTKRGERYMEKNKTFFELDGLNFGLSDLWSASNSDSEGEQQDFPVRSWA